MQRSRHRRRIVFATLFALCGGILAALTHPDARNGAMADRIAHAAERTGEYLRPPV
ncbi:hypothetical protein [Sphingomonas baiyangensis]|uniref:hypothetical protein n=1 Tax=Sphingomonas baiyangensis TaxID=2572576 RepID=UPI00146BD5AF|nr:hypothetical protein [Sphingomonas baiyangensis]